MLKLLLKINFFYVQDMSSARKNAVVNIRSSTCIRGNPSASTCSRTCGRCRGDERGNTMAAIEIFSSSVSYKYKSRIHSFASIAVLLLIVLSLITPLFIIYHAGGKVLFRLLVVRHCQL